MRAAVTQPDRAGPSAGEIPGATTREQVVRFAGFDTYGQITQADGQFSGFRGCTAVICVLQR
ncbi:MAG: hypothetical protein ACREK1_05315, partial [Longimicrobiales bacterium]